MGPYRILTVAAGVVCGLALATGTMLAGALAPVPAQWYPAPAAPEPSTLLGPPGPPLTGRQPELTAAALTDADLPAGASGGTRPGPAGTGRTRPAGSGATSSPVPENATCRTLFRDPAALLPPTATQRVTRDLDPDGDRLRQTVVLLDRAETAARAAAAVRGTAAGCVRFAAGTVPEVRAGAATPWPAGDEGYVVEYADGAGRPIGWLGVTRVGPALTVLHTVDPPTGRDAAATLRRAAEKLRPLATPAPPG